jgi:hypothetical protein
MLMCVLSHLRLHRPDFEELSPERRSRWLAAAAMMAIAAAETASAVASLIRMA